MKNFNKRSPSPELNAGSMADIAFLLLIFFLVTTTIVQDQGIRVKLPIWEKNPPTTRVPANNILSIKVNAANDILLKQKEVGLETIRAETKAFIISPVGLKNKPKRPENTVISLQNDRGTSYKKYLEVYNEIKAAYRELWEEASEKRFGRTYSTLDEMDRVAIRKEIPLVISESEPTDVQSLRKSGI